MLGAAVNRRARVVNRSTRARPFELPAPVGGWNARDALALMEPTDALALVNWFPRQSDVVTRRGYQMASDTETGEPVNTVMVYEDGTGIDILAVSGGSIFRVATDGVSVGGLTNDLGTEELTDDDGSDVLNGESGVILLLEDGLTSDFISHVQMGYRLICCNGEDTPFSYDGEDIIAHGWTDGSSTLDFDDLSFVFAFKSRVYFIEKNTQSFWYGGVGNVQGALTEFDLSVTGNYRGSLKVLTAITNDGGDGRDDLFVAIFDSGDVAVYQGSNPGDAENWALIGKYKIGRPLSRFGHISNGGDVTIITDRGYEMLTRSTAEGEGVKLRSMLSDKIQNDVTRIIRQSGVSDLWRVALYNRGQMMIFQAPLGTTMRHHVRNIDTGAWCLFTLPSIRSSAVVGQEFVLGDNAGGVHVFDTSDTDNGTTIEFSGTTAWSSIGSRGQKKIIQLLKLNITADYIPNINISMAADFKKFLRTTQISILGQELPVEWNTIYWDDEHFWSSANETRNLWHKHGVQGSTVAARVAIAGRIGDLSWNSLTLYPTDGGMI